VLFWALDRFSREGMVPTIMHLQRLAGYGVGFHWGVHVYARDFGKNEVALVRYLRGVGF
jgi:hypothetical protein